MEENYGLDLEYTYEDWQAERVFDDKWELRKGIEKKCYLYVKNFNIYFGKHIKVSDLDKISELVKIILHSYEPVR